MKEEEWQKIVEEYRKFEQDMINLATLAGKAFDELGKVMGEAERLINEKRRKSL